jgi:energy-coupling factor transport system substrate-specific component
VTRAGDGNADVADVADVAGYERGERSVAMRRFAGAALPVASVVGAGVFLWPFVGASLPAASAASAFGFGTAAALAAVELAAGRLDSRRLALLAALSAIDAAARAVVVTGIGGFSPIFLLILCGGYVYGAEYGFLLGATTMLVSALVTGGLGPWLPYQLFAVGWVGALAGLAGRGRTGRPTRRDVAVLAVVGVVTGYGFGAAMDVWNWTFYQSSPGLGFHVSMPVTEALDHFARFYVVTSLAYDTFRAVGNAVMVAVLGAPVLVALARLRARLQVSVDPSVDESVVATG